MIIAEIGQHWQDMDTAKKMILQARDAGAGLVKFQLYSSEKLYGEPGHNELSFEQAKELFDFGAANGIEVFFSVFDVERVKWCEKIGVKRYKLAYSQRNNLDLYRVISKTQKPIIVSCGASESGPLNFGLVRTLLCVPQYPAKLDGIFDGVYFEKTITDFSDGVAFEGFSDHTIGLTAAKIALARGAHIVEKHFCLDHQTGVDAAWSMDKDELKELVDWEKLVQSAL